jgi:hypothetical protein
MSKLVELDLSFTDVSYLDTGDLVSLDIAGAPSRPGAVTDRGVVTITREKFPKLTRLYLYETEVSDAAVEELKKRMPGLAVYRHEPLAAGAAAGRPTNRPTPARGR